MSVLLERTQPYYVRVSGEQVNRTVACGVLDRAPIERLKFL